MQKTCEQIAAFKPDLVITGMWLPSNRNLSIAMQSRTAFQRGNAPSEAPAGVCAPGSLAGPLPSPRCCVCCLPAEKGLSDLAAHYLMKSGISAIRRLRKTDNNRVARACGATIVSRPGAHQGLRPPRQPLSWRPGAKPGTTAAECGVRHRAGMPAG